MKTVFDKTTRDELTGRISTLNQNSVPLWGKMTVFQMMKHCSSWEEMLLKNEAPGRILISRLFGRMVLKAVLKNDKPLRKNSPTVPSLTIKETTGDIDIIKNKWMAAVESFAAYSNPVFIHPFFGKMTKEQVGYFVYKHDDHHLRQFAV